MYYIISRIEKLSSYFLTVLEDSEQCRPDSCPHCGYHKLWKHGHRLRYPDRSNPTSRSLNPVKIFRFRCVRCKRTCSSIPECIPPRRWYTWESQEDALKAYVRGDSLRQIAQNQAPARSTIARWIQRFKDSFAVHADHLRQKIKALQLHHDFASFWRCCLSELSLAKVMWHLHQAHIAIP